MADELGTLAQIQDWFTRANNVGVPRNAYTAATLDGQGNPPIDGLNNILDTYVAPPVKQISQDYNNAGGGVLGAGAAAKGALGNYIDATSRYVVEPAINAFNYGVSSAENTGRDFVTGFSKGPTQAAADYAAEQARISTAAQQPKPQQPQPVPQQAIPVLPDPVGSRPADSVDMNERIMRSQPGFDLRNQEASLVNNGFSPSNQQFISADGSKPANFYYKTENGKTRYEIPGAKGIGGASGFVEFQGERKGGGSFSVMPGISNHEKQQYQEIMAREADARKQNEMADFVNRFLTPPDGMNQMQAQLFQERARGIQGLMALQDSQEKNAAANRLAGMEYRRKAAHDDAWMQNQNAQLTETQRNNMNKEEEAAYKVRSGKQDDYRKFMEGADTAAGLYRKALSAPGALIDQKASPHDIIAPILQAYGVSPTNDGQSPYYLDKASPGVIMVRRSPTEIFPVQYDDFLRDHRAQQWKAMVGGR